MKRRLSACLVALAMGWTPALAQAPIAPPTIEVLGTRTTTLSGQEITGLTGPVQVTMSRVTIPAGGMMPPHKHPYQRLAIVVEGAVKVTNLVTGTVSIVKAGEISAESRDQWHKGEALDGKPAVLLVIDQTPPGESNMIRMAP